MISRESEYWSRFSVLLMNRPEEVANQRLMHSRLAVALAD
jgi:hypothetical protein